MIDDDYSDNMNADDNFEEEYIDDDYDDSKKKPQNQKNDIKKDFWDPPKQTIKSNAISSTQQNTQNVMKTNSILTSNNNKNNIANVAVKPIVNNNTVTKPPVSNTYNLNNGATNNIITKNQNIYKDEEEDADENYGDDYEDDDFDNDEEENFKKTAVEFAKQLNTLKAQNDTRKAQVDKLEKGTKPGQSNNNNAQKEDEEDYDDDFDQEYENIVNQQNKKLQQAKQQNPIGSNKNAVIGKTNNPSISKPNASIVDTRVQSKNQRKGNGSIDMRTEVQSTPEKSVTSKVIQKHVEDRNPYKFIEKTLGEARAKLDKMKGTPQLLETLSDNLKKKKFLKSENKQLRDQLKKMSENVNLLIEKMNQETLRKKRLAGGGNSSRPGSQKIRTREKEIQNTDKAISNLIREHQRLKKRLEEVQSPDFLLNLKKNIRSTEQEIKNYEKMLQQLHVEQIRREKRLDKIIERNEPETMKQINDQTSQLAYLNEKIAELRDQYDKSEKLKDQQLEQLEELKQRFEKLNQIADHYGIEVDKHDQNNKEYEKLNKDLEQLEKQKRIARSAIDTLTKKYESALTEKKKEFDQLYYKKAMILKSYNEKIKLLKYKGEEIQDLIEKAKTGADKGLLDILSKWEEANRKIFEKYPDGDEAEFSILEAAASEIQKVEQSKQITVSTQEDQKKGKKKKEIDEDMQTYLEELKQKEQDIQIKLKLQQEQEKLQRDKDMKEKQVRDKQDKEEADRKAKELSSQKLKLDSENLQKEAEEQKRREIEKRHQEQQEKFEKLKAQQEEEERINSLKEEEERSAKESQNKQPNLGSKPFGGSRRQNEQVRTSINQNDTSQIQSNKDDIENEVKEEISNDVQQNKFVSQNNQSTIPSQQTPVQDQTQKKGGAFAKPSFMMKPGMKRTEQVSSNQTLEQNQSSVLDNSRNQALSQNTSIQNQKTLETVNKPPVSFTEKYGIANNIQTNQPQIGGGTSLNQQTTLASLGQKEQTISSIPTLGNEVSRRSIQQPAYVPEQRSRFTLDSNIPQSTSNVNLNEPAKKQIVDPFAKYDNYDPLQKLQADKPQVQQQIQPQVIQQIPSLIENKADIKPVQNRSPWDAPVSSDIKEIPQLAGGLNSNNNNLPINKPAGLWGDQNPISTIPTLGGGASNNIQPLNGGGVQKQNIWGDAPLQQPKQNLWDAKPFDEPKILGSQQNNIISQPKKNLWDEQPNDPIVNNISSVPQTNKYDFGVNDNSSIPALKDNKSNINSNPQNDYLSMIGDRNSRQPRMRMGGAPKQEIQASKVKPTAMGGGIMNGLDELEGL
eukprot:403356196